MPSASCLHSVEQEFGRGIGIGGDLRGRQYQIATRCPPVIAWHPAIYHLFRPSPAPPDRHVDSQSLESQPEGRTLCTAWQGFLSVGAEERSGAQKTAPWAPHGRDRQPPSFSRCYGGQKMGPVPTADHAATGQPGAHPPWDWENRSIFYPFERRLPQRYGGGGVKMTRYLP